jgi:5'-3' exonuclease
VFGGHGHGMIVDVRPLLLTDTASLYFRAFYGVPASITAPDGQPINAVRGFLDMLARLVDELRPGRLVCCLDADWRPEFRVAALPSYKAHRVAGPGNAEDVPPALASQVPILLDVLAALGVATLGVPGFEADDVIGTLAAREPGPVDVVTGDRDLFAVVDDDRAVRVVYVARGVSRRELVDAADVRRRYGVSPRQYVDLAILRGDPSDGLPGVPGIGEKTAAGLLARWGSLAALLAALDADEDVPRRGVLLASRDYLEAARAVVPVRTDVPTPADLQTALPLSPADPDRLLDVGRRWGLDGPLSRLLAALSAAHAQDADRDS